MNTTILQEEIQWLLEAIKEQYEVIRAYEDKIPQIELDILMENVRKLYGKLHTVSRVNNPFAYADIRSPEIPQVKPLEYLESPPLAARNLEAPKNEEPSVKIQYDEVDGNLLKEESTEVPVQWQNLDLFNTEMPGFSGKLQEARQQSMPPKARNNLQVELKTLITINEKFLFINELFDGNLREYNENLEALCRFLDLKAALEFLDLLRKKNLWNSESIAFNRLKELLEQRFNK